MNTETVRFCFPLDHENYPEGAKTIVGFVTTDLAVEQIDVPVTASKLGPFRARLGSEVHAVLAFADEDNNAGESRHLRFRLSGAGRATLPPLPDLRVQYITADEAEPVTPDPSQESPAASPPSPEDPAS